MRIYEITESVPEDWNLGGGWITPEGTILACDHHSNIHHTDLAFDEYKDFIDDIEYDEEGNPEDYYKDIAVDMANEDGWIRISTRGNDMFSVSWIRKPAEIAIKKLLYWVKDVGHEYHQFELSTPSVQHAVYPDARSFLIAIKRSFSA